jgi:hypothetical protein
MICTGAGEAVAWANTLIAYGNRKVEQGSVLAADRAERYSAAIRNAPVGLIALRISLA